MDKENECNQTFCSGSNVSFISRTNNTLFKKWHHQQNKQKPKNVQSVASHRILKPISCGTTSVCANTPCARFVCQNGYGATRVVPCVAHGFPSPNVHGFNKPCSIHLRTTITLSHHHVGRLGFLLVIGGISRILISSLCSSVTRTASDPKPCVRTPITFWVKKRWGFLIRGQRGQCDFDFCIAPITPDVGPWDAMVLFIPPLVWCKMRDQINKEVARVFTDDDHTILSMEGDASTVISRLIDHWV